MANEQTDRSGRGGASPVVVAREKPGDDMVEKIQTLNKTSQELLERLTADGKPRTLRVGSQVWKIFRVSGHDILSVAQIYEQNDEEVATPQMFFLVVEGRFVPYCYRDEALRIEQDSVELSFDEQDRANIVTVDADLQRQHAIFADRWLGALGSQLVDINKAPGILTRSENDRPGKRAETVLRARAVVPVFGGGQADALVEYYQSKEQVEDGRGVVIRFMVKESVGFRPFAVVHETGVDLHLCGEAESETLLELVHAVLEDVRPRPAGTSGDINVELFAA